MDLRIDEFDNLLAGLNEINEDLQRMVRETDKIIGTGKEPRRYLTRDADKLTTESR